MGIVGILGLGVCPPPDGELRNESSSDVAPACLDLESRIRGRRSAARAMIDRSHVCSQIFTLSQILACRGPMPRDL